MLRGDPGCKGHLVRLHLNAETVSAQNMMQHLQQSTLVACSQKAISRELLALIVVNHGDSLSRAALCSPSPAVIFSPQCLWCQVPWTRRRAADCSSAFHQGSDGSED